MNVKYVSTLPISKCQSVYQLKNKSLSNRQKLVSWASKWNVTDIVTVDARHFSIPTKQHELVEFVINPDMCISFEEVDSMITELSQYSKKYFFIAANKFLLYTNSNRETNTSTNFDQDLISHWETLLDLKLDFYMFDSYDRGNLGNFVYPVTQLGFIKP